MQKCRYEEAVRRARVDTDQKAHLVLCLAGVAGLLGQLLQDFPSHGNVPMEMRQRVAVDCASAEDALVELFPI